jgi:sulfoxide reductase catalytic subunit YedY
MVDIEVGGKEMLIKKPADIPYSEITPKDIYLNRRKFLAAVPAAILGARALKAGTKLPNATRNG